MFRDLKLKIDLVIVLLRQQENKKLKNIFSQNTPPTQG